MDEARIINGCKKAERSAQKQLYDQYADGMLLVCLRYVKHQPDAEEMMLNGFYKFFSTIERFVYNGTGSIGAWLKKIMVNECLMFLRKKGKLVFVNEEYAAQVADRNAWQPMETAELLKHVLALPDGYRTVFNLYVIEDRSHREIAAALGISEGTSKSQLNKARTMLQKMIEKEVRYYEK